MVFVASKGSEAFLLVGYPTTESISMIAVFFQLIELCLSEFVSESIPSQSLKHEDQALKHSSPKTMDH